MGGQEFKDQLLHYSDVSEGDVDDDLEKFKEEAKKKKLNSPLPKTPPPAPLLPKTPPPAPPLPITPVPETPDYLSVDVEEEDPFGAQCMICCTRVQRGMLELVCDHSFHRRCLMPWVQEVPKKGKRFLTSQARCPCCRGWALAKNDRESPGKDITDLVKPVVDQFHKMCDILLENDDIDQKQKDAIKEMKSGKKELPFMKEYVFYLCNECGSLYFGGLKECQQLHGEEDEEKDQVNHICVKCSNEQFKTNFPTKCEKHGEAFIVFKCRYCCNISNFHCGVGKGGNTHFCERCHKAWNSGTIKPIPCPGPPECSSRHVPNGDEPENEQCLGCVLCRKYENED